MSDNEVNSKKTLNLCRRGYKNIEKITLSSTSYQEKRQNLPILNIGKCICNICDKAFNQSGIYITMGLMQYQLQQHISDLGTHLMTAQVS